MEAGRAPSGARLLNVERGVRNAEWTADERRRTKDEDGERREGSRCAPHFPTFEPLREMSRVAAGGVSGRFR
jgi:hypothetical protein